MSIRRRMTTGASSLASTRLLVLITALVLGPAISPRALAQLDDGPASEGIADWRPPELDPAAREEIVRGNIFADTRPGRQPAQSESSSDDSNDDEPDPEESGPPAPPPDPDDNLVLVGVSLRNGEPRAFIEDRSTGQVRRVTETGPFSGGRITAIDLSGVTYRVDAEARRIRPGQTFTGYWADARPAAGRSGRGFPNQPSRAGSDTPQRDGDDDPSRAEILERMRQRRASEVDNNSPEGPDR